MSGLRAWAVVWLGLGLGLGLAACGGGGGGSSTDPAAATDAAADAAVGVLDAGGAEAASPPAKTVTVTALAPAVPGSPGGKASATWAAWQSDSGAWRAATPTSPGTYSFAVSGARWAIALACVDGTASSAVAVHRRLVDTLSLEVTLDPECLAPPASVHSLTGALSNAPPTSSWLEFGYPLDSRGSVFSGAAYELVNVRDGTWDFAFGLRDESFSPLSRVVLQRNQAFKADTGLDLDWASSLVPVPKPLAIHGLDPGETVGYPFTAYAAA